MSYRDDCGARYGPWTPEMRVQMLDGGSFKNKKKFRLFMKKKIGAAAESRQRRISQPAKMH